MPLPSRYVDAEDELISATVAISIPAKRLQKLEKEYRGVQAQEEAAESELAQMQAKCARLQGENKSLTEKVPAADSLSYELCGRAPGIPWEC